MTKLMAQNRSETKRLDTPLDQVDTRYNVLLPNVRAFFPRTSFFRLNSSIYTKSMLGRLFLVRVVLVKV